MKARVICNTKTCKEFATHAIHWTDGEVKMCLDCARKMVGVGNAMDFGVPSSTFRQLTLNELFEADEVEEAAQALVDFFTERDIPTTTQEAIEGTQKWVRLFFRWDNPQEGLKDYHKLWTALALAIVRAKDEDEL